MHIGSGSNLGPNFGSKDKKDFIALGAIASPDRNAIPESEKVANSIIKTTNNIDFELIKKVSYQSQSSVPKTINFQAKVIKGPNEFMKNVSEFFSGPNIFTKGADKFFKWVKSIFRTIDNPEQIKAKLQNVKASIKGVNDRYEPLDFMSLEKKYGLTEKQCKKLRKFYLEVGPKIEQYQEPTVFHRHDKKHHNLPLGVAIVPSGPFKGIYILLKTHTDNEEYKMGTSGVVTDAIDLSTGKVMSFKSAAAENITDDEVNAQHVLSNDTDHVVVGIVFNYSGDVRDRVKMAEVGERTGDITTVQKKKDVPKRAILMEKMNGGNVNDQVDALDLSKPDDSHLICDMAGQTATSLAIVHENGIVHRDLKEENLLLTRSHQVKIADFGNSLIMGTLATKIVGSPGFIAPELINDIRQNRPHYVQQSSDVWQLGICYLDMFHPELFEDWLQIQENIIEMGLHTKQQVEQLNKKLEGKDDRSSPDYIIFRCLQGDPTKRPTADQIADAWKIFNEKGKFPKMPIK